MGDQLPPAPELPPEAEGPTPTDLKAVIDQAMELNDALERAWSEALDPSNLDPAQQELRTRLEGALQVFHRVVTDSDRRIAAAGIEVRLMRWPPNSEDALSVATADPSDLRARRRPFQQALLLAFELLAQALGALTEPKGETDEPGTANWWQSGAFMLVRIRARLVVRVARELERVDADLLGTGAPPPSEVARSRAFEANDLAQAAFSRGDPEASLIHCTRAVTARIASLGLGTDPLDIRFSELAASHADVEIWRLLARAQEISCYQGAPTSEHIGEVVLLAHSLIPQVDRLVRNPDPDLLAPVVDGASVSNG